MPTKIWSRGAYGKFLRHRRNVPPDRMVVDDVVCNRGKVEGKCGERLIWRESGMEGVDLDIIDDQLAKLQFLVENSRILEAQVEAIALTDMISSLTGSDILAGNLKIEQHQEMLHTIHSRAEELKEIINMCSTDLSQWNLGSEMFGVSTYYKVEDDGLLSVRMEGIQDIPIFEQIIVFYECALYKEWIPFCKRSELLHKISVFRCQFL